MSNFWDEGARIDYFGSGERAEGKDKMGRKNDKKGSICFFCSV